MQEFDQMVERQRKWMLCILALFIVLAAVLPAYRPVFLGLLLGGAFSYYGMRLLQSRARVFGQSVIESGKPKGLGTVIRMLGAVVAVALALYFDDRVNYYGVVAGLATAYIVLLVDGLIYYIWRYWKK